MLVADPMLATGKGHPLHMLPENGQILYRTYCRVVVIVLF